MNEPSRYPKVQFNLSAFFFWTLMFSMLMATLGPILRSWNSEKRWVFLGLTGVQFAIFLGAILSCWIVRARVIAAAGPLEFGSSFKTRRYKTRWENVKAAIPMLTAVSYQFFLLQIISHDTKKDILFATFGPQLQCTWFLAANCIAHWFDAGSRDVEICEKGYIYGAFNFVAWKSTVSVRPGDIGQDSIVVVVLDEAGLKGTQSFKADPELREEFVARIAAKIQSN